jgi:CHAT domain-containing protein
LVTWDPSEKTQQNGIIIGHTACVSHSKSGVCFRRFFPGENKWLIRHLNASTKYYIRVYASTKAGQHGLYSKSKGFFTNASKKNTKKKLYFVLIVFVL